MVGDRSPALATNSSQAGSKLCPPTSHPQGSTVRPTKLPFAGLSIAEVVSLVPSALQIEGLRIAAGELENILLIDALGASTIWPSHGATARPRQRKCIAGCFAAWLWELRGEGYVGSRHLAVLPASDVDTSGMKALRHGPLQTIVCRMPQQGVVLTTG